ncbi:hypothetical protein FPQ18DRAFT_361874 [Pyronema domesticum]|nr:hypothetical protein FPQ18DRAFT_361874 [Pyronema domesticum]
MKQEKIVTILVAAVAATALASPRRGGVDELGGIDMGSIQNKVRSGAIAIANSDRPHDERKNQSHYRNGDKVDTTITDVPERDEEPCEHQCEHKCDHHKHERRDKMLGDCQAEFPRLATLADASEVEDTYQCCGVLPGKDITNFDGTAVARVLGYYEYNPLKDYINNVPNTNGTCIDSCVEAGYDALTSAGPGGCHCMNTFNLPIQLPVFKSNDEYDMDNCLAVYRVDFVAPKKAAPASAIDATESVEPVGLADAAQPTEVADTVEPTEVVDTVEPTEVVDAVSSEVVDATPTRTGLFDAILGVFHPSPKETISKEVFVTKISTHTIPMTAEVTSTKIKQVVVTEVQTAFKTKTKFEKTTATVTSTDTAYTTATESRILY